MTDSIDTPDVRELAEDAIRKTINDIGDHDQWLSFGSRSRVADAVLAAVTPVIRQQVAEEIAWHIEHPIGPQEVRWAPIARRWMAESAAIARSHSTQPETGQDHG